MNAIRLVGYFFASFLLFPIGTNADEALYQSRCAACHGNSGEGLEAMSAPAIAGLDQQYLTRQLEHFRSGVRGSQTSDSQGVLMAQISKSLSDQDITALATYLSSQPFINAEPAASNGGFVGAGLYRNCQSCHGAKAQGSAGMQAPRLAGQHRDYLKRQLTNFRNGLRGSHPDDKLGQQMKVIADGLTDDQAIEKILQFISHKGK